MEWVKSKVDYYRLTAIATGSADLEVMFKRGDCLAGEIGEGGFIPDAMLPSLTRKPAQAKRLAGELVRAGLWDRVKGGYIVVDFAVINTELIRLTEKKKRDRDRKRADREAERAARASTDVSVDESTDSPAPNPAPRPGDSLLDHQTQTQKNAAAAAPVSERPIDLPPAVAILRGQLEAHRIAVQWSNLTTAELDEISTLAGIHGDNALVQSALRSYQPAKPPATAKAWLGQWRDLRAPGDLAVVTEPCPEPGHSGTTKHCTQCASEQKAASR